MADGTCIDCGATVTRKRSRIPKRCQACNAKRSGRRPDTPCADCGKLLYSSPRSLRSGERRCQPCRRNNPSGRCLACDQPLGVASCSGRWCSDRCRARTRFGIYEFHATCIRCGADFTRPTSTVGPHIGHCSDRCAGLDRKDVRRAESFGAHIEPVCRWRVFVDHGNQCHICNEPIDMTLDRSDPDYPSVDHVVPLALGGPHTQDNLRPAHMRCNSLKGIDEVGTPY